ncbi:hypothetical protein D3C72_331800 [compost metagenome]
MFVSRREHRDIVHRAQNQIVSGFQLTTDHREITTAVQRNTALIRLAGVYGQVVPGFHNRGHIGAVVTFALGGFATSVRSLFLLVVIG